MINRLLLTIACTTFLAFSVSAEKIRTEGAAVGEFTMDWDAAKELAAEKNLPIFIDFTGSDWCGWCKLMHKAVFVKDDWKAYAKKNLVLVTIDFPQNESIVPAKWRARNETLSATYKVDGFPTYVILNSAGTKELGRLGAGKDKTPASFAKEIDTVLKAAAKDVVEVAPKANTDDTITDGEWSNNFAAAQKYATEKDRPILLNFTGSDWCYPCKVMKKNVFTKSEWTAWAKDNVVLVTVDFPSDKSKQSTQLKRGNKALQKQFDVRSYPTYVLVRPDGKTEIDRVGGSDTMTPASFIKELGNMLNPQAKPDPAIASTDTPTPIKPTPTPAADHGSDILRSGAELGKFTMDYDAAVKLAGEKKLPLFLDFTGSDWCGWCKRMAKSVFSKQEWSDWAKDNVVLVTIDFPKKVDLVPEAFRAKNRELQKKFGVRGYPTYVILDYNAATELGRLGAGKDKTPASFIGELSPLLPVTPEQIQAHADKLGGENGKAYLQAHTDLEQAEKDLADATKRIADAKQTIRDLKKMTLAATAIADEPKKPEQAAVVPKKEEDVDTADDHVEEGVMTKGHTAGRWTMDYDAAKAASQETGKPMLLNFTGSDWCGWCKLMDKGVFADGDWTAYAKKNLILVTIDFPKDKSIVPEAYVARNKTLKGEFGVRGFPTYVLIGLDGKKVGQLGAGRGKTAASFSAEVEELLEMTEGRIAAYAKSLPEAEAGAYREAIAAFKSAKDDQKAFLSSRPEQSEENAKKFATLSKNLQTSEDAIRIIKAKHTAKSLGDKAEVFLEAHERLTKANIAIQEFMASQPERNEENNTRFGNLMKEKTEAKEAVKKFTP